MIKKIEHLLKKPNVYEKGNARIWTDDHIANHLLEAHLDPMHEAASRKPNDIEQAIAWINGMNKTNCALNILDLGCGPGLYTSRLHQLGHSVTGVDFNKKSLAYAKEQSNDITYIYSDYLTLNLNQTFDIIMLIYCDFGVLTPHEQGLLIEVIKKHLKLGGLFIFDGYSEGYYQKLEFKRDWEYQEQGFWSNLPHLVLSETFNYPEEKVFLDQHIVIEKKSKPKVYRFYNHIYDIISVGKIFEKKGFNKILAHENVISDKTITFYTMNLFG